MNAARQHALHWAFFTDIMNMPADDIYNMFSAWCESMPQDEMTGIMAIADGLSDNGNTKDIPDPDNLYTEEEIWNDTSSNAEFSLN